MVAKVPRVGPIPTEAAATEIYGGNIMEKGKQCGARCPNVRGGEEFVCELRSGHKWKHSSDAGGYWTDGGAESIRKELARRAEIEREPF